jgi:2-phosphosulfolactate phosphatase
MLGLRGRQYGRRGRVTAAFFAQDGFRRRFEWGLVGARRLQPWVDVLVVVDVLSFSTAVDVALARGAAIAPFAWMDERAVAYAQKIDAYLAVGRTEVSDDHPYSLSPVSIQQLPRGARLVLPSPNGAAICADMATAGVPVLTACLRNATAVAAAALTLGETVGVIAAGERWPDGTLRPALEDLAGAGAVLTALDGAASP